MKKIKKIGMVVLSICLIMSTHNFTFAESNQQIKNEICEMLRQQCEAYGISLTSEEIDALKEEIEICAEEYKIDNECSLEESYIAIFEETKNEMEFEFTDGEINGDNNGISVCSSKGDGKVQLPKATLGYIFFCDTNSAWNHCGLYTSSSRIIEAEPDYDVHEVPITDSTAKQSPTGESHDQSSILSVDNATSTDRKNAVDWAKKYIGKEYDFTFLNNKKNTSDGNKKFNCSELVWKSYRFGSGSKIDLDYNGGSTVYPNNIYKSDLVTIEDTF